MRPKKPEYEDSNLLVEGGSIAFELVDQCEDVQSARNLVFWLMGNLPTIQFVFPDLYDGIYHILDMSYPTLGVGMALR